MAVLPPHRFVPRNAHHPAICVLARGIPVDKPTSQYLFRFSERPVFREQAKGTVQGANNMPQSV